MNLYTSAFAKTFTPLLNTPDFSLIFGGDTIPLDGQGLLRAVEAIAFPQTPFQILFQTGRIVQVKTQAYPYEGDLFVDERFLFLSQENIVKKHIDSGLPSSKEILNTLISLVGTRYCWGGNCLGVPEMLSFYPPRSSKIQQDDLILKGFDCSGLIYYATHGITPRNTSSWFSFGQEIPIAGKSHSELFPLLKPLDAILWKGHIIFVQDPFHVIESRVGKGVVVTPLQQRFLEIKQEERSFVIRRWHPDFLSHT